MTAKTPTRQLTIETVETIHDLETGVWTAWIVGNSKIWGTGKTEQGAINDLWIYQGLLVGETATRIEAGGQVWQEA